LDERDIKLSNPEFEAIKTKVYELAGISLSDAKRTLVVSRLSKIVVRLGLADFSAYVGFLNKKAGADDVQDFINALTTNLTRFYREEHHFDHLITHVGDLIKAPPRKGAGGRPRLRLWSAGCSTGQEPYTMALALLHAYPALKRWDFRILATDIDTRVVETAAAGTYKANDLAGLSRQRTAFFETGANGEVCIPASARALVTFKPLNLMQDWPIKGPFDAIFCRNVAIYFDKPTQTRMFTRMADMLAPDGFLYIGHSENLGGCDGQFKLVGKTTYRPAKAAQQKAVA
jgi:chemotaxis protein methyltransferase CheR